MSTMSNEEKRSAEELRALRDRLIEWGMRGATIAVKATHPEARADGNVVMYVGAVIGVNARDIATIQGPVSSRRGSTIANVPIAHIVEAREINNAKASAPTHEEEQQP